MKKGDFVRIDYVGKVGDEVFDLTDEELAKELGIWRKDAKYGPIPVIVGEEMVIKGVDEALLDMEVGQEKTFEVPPEKGFGFRDPSLVKTLPISALDFKPQPGMLISHDNGIGKILSVSAGRVTIDFNHPLVGKKLLYKVKVVEKIEGDEEKAKTIMEYYGAEYRIEGNKVIAKPFNGMDRAKELMEKYTSFTLSIE